ncbi:glycosyltransferase [uncultured Cohaesibacter sp.]|uniref:glycosyltransferase family 8 protein n=1 Tax=uncultured Cohaesibacter sp. TaxID=1002546 RepID=UPI0029C7FD86|nr:glycosyltransferase [uncultured Cohaesibacter sp.]
MIKQRMNIATSCNDMYANYVFITLASINSTLARTHDVHFYLMQSAISDEKIASLEKFCDGLDLHFHNVFVDDDEFLAELTFYSRAKDRERYYDGICHLFLPDDIDRIMYIDAGDILFLSEDYPFYFEDFKNKSLLVSTYWNLHKDKWDFQQFDSLWGGFNSGHILIDVQRLRDLKLTPQSYVDYVHEWARQAPEKEHLFGGDQAFLTAFFAGDIATIEKENPYNLKVSALNGIAPDFEPKSIHFNAMFAGLKPWDVPFRTPKDLLMYKLKLVDKKKKKKGFFKKEETYKYSFAGYENECILKWWEVCKTTPVYDELKSASLSSTKFVYALCKHIRDN